MTDFEPQEDLPPVAHVTIVYTGPVAPHWELQVRYGDQKLLDDFWARVNARLLLLPKHDPQFRRNRERVNRDAERERITCDWDLGEHDADTTITPVAETPVEPTAPEAPSEAAIEDPAVAEVPSEAAIEDPAVAEVPSEAAEADPSGDVDAVVETDAAETQTADA
jgi:hypothetical protein